MDMDATQADRELAMPVGVVDGFDALQQPGPEATVIAVGAGITTAAPNPLAPGALTAQLEFDQLIHELCARPPVNDASLQRVFNGALVRYQDLRLKLGVPENADCWPAARDGLAALKANNPKLADTISENLAVRISKSTSLSRVILGIVAYLVFAFIITSAYLTVSPMQAFSHPEVVFADIGKLVKAPDSLDAAFSAAVFGGLGSVVSLLLRIGSFESIRGRSGLYLFLFGLVQPIIGLMIGGVVGAAMAAHMINASFQTVAADAPVNIFFVTVVGFLCGFSERVAKTALATASQAAGLNDQPAVAGAMVTVTKT